MLRLLYETKWVGIVAGLLLGLVASSLSAQQIPTPAAAQAALQQPGAADAVRARLRESGLTPEQVRARLIASGYSASLLDNYLNPAQPGDSTSAESPNKEQSDAMRILGIPDAEQLTAPLASGTITTAGLPPSGIFGVDVFRRNTTQFLPLLSGPAPADYRLGPGDALVLILTGDVEATHQLSITREGFVLIPQVGQVFLSNLTLDQAKGLLYDRLGRVYSGVRRGTSATTHFELSVANVRAVQVFVIGEVGQPGAYQMSALGSVLTALYTAGGVTEKANLRKVGVRRNGRTVATFDLYDYLLNGDTHNDIRLENGDVVFVGVRERRVNVLGSVQRPSWYDVAERETLREVLHAAGGLKADASIARVTIDRILPAAQRSGEGPQRVVIDVPVTPRDSFIVPAIPLEDDDRITVFALNAETAGYVEITGNVYVQGRVGFQPGMRLSQLLQRAGGIRPGTYTGRVHIDRLNPVDLTHRLIPVAIPADSAAPWVDDPELKDRDVVSVYNLMRQRDEQMVVISGAVNTPTRVPYRQGMTLRDLVLAAEGLAPGASLDTAEIARLPSPRGVDQLASTLRVPLDSTYLFDRDTSGRYIGAPGGQFRRTGTPDVELKPFDNVVILRQPGWELQRTVVIQGQVRFPGRYALETRTDRLSDLIRRAGGLAPAAYPQGGEFWRIADGRGRVGIDLPRVLRDRRFRDNVILVAGDSVFIPEYVPLVQVGGAVHSPASVVYAKGRSLRSYISAGGGFTSTADANRTYVIQPNGEIESVHRRFLLPDSWPTPQPGAVVIVPLADQTEKKDWVALTSTIVQILTSAITLVVVATK